MVNAASTATRKLIICAVIAVIIGFVIGILIGRFATCPEPEKKDGVFLPGMSETLLTDGDSAVGQELLNSVDNTMIEKYLKYLTLRPHVAGSEKNLDLANWIKDNWLESGFDDVKLTPYDVLLSFPDSAHPNVVRLLNETGGIVYQSPPKEPSLTGEDDPDALPPYNAYSPSGLVEGEMVYVNYGRVEDFDFLEKNTSIDLKGKIVIARYGKIFRGSKVKLAALKGAIGVVLFSDPYDYTDPDEDRVYPDAWWLPGTGSQRGTVRTTQGDPLTPGYPAIKSAYRYKEDNPNLGLPVIPAHPIGYDIAEKILSEMGGEEAPTGWQGGLNLTYKLGPALAKTGWKIQINISTKNEMKRIYNVIGIIKGLIEPDRYVLMGNHRDAWVYGAMDPSSGTAVMMEASRVIGEKIKSGTWRPRRSLMFCSWGAEEYGLIGSDEWVEHYRKTLRERAIMYINVDIATHGNHSFFASGAPLIHQATYEAAKKVPNPNPEEVEAGRPTIYDTWLNNFPLIGADKKPVGVPRIWALGSASDYAALLQKAGVSAVDVFYAYNLRKYPKLAFYPLYHTVYETFYAVKNLVDRNFETHRAVCRFSVEMLRSMSDSLIIPFNVTDYASTLDTLWKTLQAEQGAMMKSKLTNYNDLTAAITKFSDETEAFEERIAKVNKNDPLAVRAVNDQLLLLEKAFLDPTGLPGRNGKKHLLMAESSTDAYAGSSFPGLVDLMFEIDKAPDVDARWEEVKKHFSAVIYTVEAASNQLRDVIKFIPEE